MINIPNAIIRDIASYVVIDTTSPLYKLKGLCSYGRLPPCTRLLHMNIASNKCSDFNSAIKYRTQNKGTYAFVLHFVYTPKSVLRKAPFYGDFRIRDFVQVPSPA